MQMCSRSLCNILPNQKKYLMVRGPTVGMHFQLHMQIWPWDRIEDLFHPVSICKLQRLSFQVSELDLRCKIVVNKVEIVCSSLQHSNHLRNSTSRKETHPDLCNLWCNLKLRSYYMSLLCHLSWCQHSRGLAAKTHHRLMSATQNYLCQVMNSKNREDSRTLWCPDAKCPDVR